MDDLVKRLREKGGYGFDAPDDYRWQYDPDCREAADEIERLRRAVNKMADAAGPAYTPRWVLDAPWRAED